MFKELINNYKEKRKQKQLKKSLKRIRSNPRDQLDMLTAGYKKFSAELSERERSAMKKKIKQLERALKNWEKVNG